MKAEIKIRICRLSVAFLVTTEMMPVNIKAIGNENRKKNNVVLK